MPTTFLKQLRPIHPDSEATDGPAAVTATAAELDRAADNRLRQVARAMTRTDADRQSTRSRTPKRDEYNRFLRMAVYSLLEAEKLNANESHPLNLILLDIKNLLL